MSNSALYGGEEIGALIFDPGHYSIRIGYAQEDTPKADIPAIVGIAPENISLNDTQTKYYVDTTFLHSPKPNMELYSYMNEGIIENWNLFEKILDYSYNKVIQSRPENHPVLFSESPWNPNRKREELSELMFEKYQIPAIFMAKNAALAAFANGRTTALVIDSGATHTSAVPVYEGYVIKNAAIKSPFGGDFLSSKAKEMLDSLQIDLTPASLITTKDSVKEQESPKFIKKNLNFQPSYSWIDYMTKTLIQDFQQTVFQISDTPTNVQYAFPSGYRQDFNQNHFKFIEELFNHQELGAGQIVAASVNLCDVDIRPALYNSMVLTGGNSLIKGFTGRLGKEIQAKIPIGMRMRMITGNATAERRFGAWLGGSILASVGTFQQMWVSMEEYQEEGKGMINKKCP